jgi:threonylcarbamoyladenosine tRNA methylthiotransferase MtaB
VSTIPDVAIGVDVMVGFPGETDRAFDRTCRLIEELPVAYLHVFPFSVQRGTAAESLDDRVSPETSKKRAQTLRELGQAKRQAFHVKAVGSTMEILIEGKRDRTTGYLKGLSSNYIPVHIDGSDSLFNQLVMVKATKAEHGKIFGECLIEP